MPAFLGLGPDNPIAWSNFYRKGGFKTALGTSGAYFAILAALIFLSVRLEPGDAGHTYGVWSNLLLGLQFLFVVVIGAGRVSATIRGDLTSGMAESLRMMPLPARHAVAGYLSSAAASLGGFFAANFVLGLLMNLLAELPAGRWLAANVILVAFAAFVWTVSAFLAFLVQRSAALLVIASLVGAFGNVALLFVAPGLIVLAGPLIGSTIFDARTAQTELALPLLVSLGAQFLVGAIFFAGAARKYRRPDALALGGWLGLALLLAFVGVSLLAIVRGADFEPVFLRREFRDVGAAVPFSGSAVVAMLVALIPLANFARLHVGWVRGRANDPDLRRTTPPLFPAALIVTAALAPMILALPEPPDRVRIACVVAAFFGFSASVIFLAAWFYRAADNAKIILGIWLVCYGFLPLTVDFVRYRLTEHRFFDEPVLATAATFSPFGLLIESATQPEADLRAGAIFHALVPLLPATLYLRRTRRNAIAPKTIHE